MVKKRPTRKINDFWGVILLYKVANVFGIFKSVIF